MSEPRSRQANLSPARRRRRTILAALSSVPGLDDTDPRQPGKDGLAVAPSPGLRRLGAASRGRGDSRVASDRPRGRSGRGFGARAETAGRPRARPARREPRPTLNTMMAVGVSGPGEGMRWEGITVCPRPVFCGPLAAQVLGYSGPPLRIGNSILPRPATNP